MTGASNSSVCVSCLPGFFCQGSNLPYPTGPCVSGYFCNGAWQAAAWHVRGGPGGVGRAPSPPLRARRLCHDAQPVVDAAGLLFAGRRVCCERVLPWHVSDGLQAEWLQPLRHRALLSEPGHGDADAVHGRVRRGVGWGERDEEFHVLRRGEGWSGVCVWGGER